jgi:hypothetical protein
MSTSDTSNYGGLSPWTEEEETVLARSYIHARENTPQNTRVSVLGKGLMNNFTPSLDVNAIFVHITK